MVCLSCPVYSRFDKCMHACMYVPARSRPVSYIQLSNGTRRKRRRRRENIKREKKKERKKKTLCSHIWLGLHRDRKEKDRVMTTNKLCILFSLFFVRRKWLMMSGCNRWCFLFVVIRYFFLFYVFSTINFERDSQKSVKKRKFKREKNECMSHVNVNYIVGK